MKKIIFVLLLSVMTLQAQTAYEIANSPNIEGKYSRDYDYVFAHRLNYLLQTHRYESRIHKVDSFLAPVYFVIFKDGKQLYITHATFEHPKPCTE